MHLITIKYKLNRYVQLCYFFCTFVQVLMGLQRKQPTLNLPNMTSAGILLYASQYYNEGARGKNLLKNEICADPTAGTNIL